MRLFLTHVDTPYRMYRENLSFRDPHLMLSEKDTSQNEIRAICAFWCDKHLSDEHGWRENRMMRAHIKGKMTSLSATYAIEDARILGDRPLTRLRELYDDGVRILTPHWQGVNRLGGAHDTDIGLTSYGRQVLSAAMEMGMVIDLSHASDNSARETLSLAKYYHAPVIASHSNFRMVTPHTRNLTDEIAYGICESGGIIGLCLVPAHVGLTRDLNGLCMHIAYAQRLGLLNALSLGTDFDGTEELISPLKHAADLTLLSDILRAHDMSDELIDSVFFSNAARVFDRRFPCLFR